MKRLTKRQKEILDFIAAYRREREYAPRYEDIRLAFGYASLATVHEHLTNLKAMGYIRKPRNQSRAIELVHVDTTEARILPLLGTVAAGSPIEAIQNNETLAVPTDLAPMGSDSYALRVQGDSMIDEQIRDGDYIVVKSGNVVFNGQTVVALVDGDSATVKKFYQDRDSYIRLQPANDAMEPLIVNTADVQIQGVVVGVIRKY